MGWVGGTSPTDVLVDVLVPGKAMKSEYQRGGGPLPFLVAGKRHEHTKHGLPWNLAPGHRSTASKGDRCGPKSAEVTELSVNYNPDDDDNNNNNNTTVH